jgi:hypothetical protein
MAKPDTAGLIRLAEAALVEGESPATITARIVAYSDAFDRWYSDAGAFIAAGDSISLGGVELVRTLNDRHGAVVELTRELMGRTEADTRGLRKKGKGMLAYTDLLPKQVSTKKLPPG